MVHFRSQQQTTCRPIFPMTLPGWADLYAWQLDRASRTPLTRQIYMQVRSAVLSGAAPSRHPRAILPYDGIEAGRGAGVGCSGV